MLRTFLPVLALFGALSSTSAASNRTIDDQTGDSVTGARPVYQPAADWKYGPDCSGCFIGTQTQLDKGKVFAGSWHDVTAGPGNVMNVTLSFTGASCLSVPSATLPSDREGDRHGDLHFLHHSE
jgi:hypothetical protein